MFILLNSASSTSKDHAYAFKKQYYLCNVIVSKKIVYCSNQKKKNLLQIVETFMIEVQIDGITPFYHKIFCLILKI